MSVTRSHNLSVGIVGLPNAGKSTLFNSITKNSVPAENFPFCTIDKNVGVVKIPDPRLDAMAQFYKAQKVVPAAITFVDIAGLVKGASEGEGLGNQFLSHIREVDLIMYVLRAFKGDKIVHVYNKVRPLDDLKIVQAELIFKDIETVEKRLGEVKRNTKSGGTAELTAQVDFMEKLLVHLNSGKSAIDLERTAEQEEILRDLWLLTNKKRIYILNTREGMEEADMKGWVEELRAYIPDSEKDNILPIDVKVVGELANMNADEKKEYLELLGGKPNEVEDVISLAHKTLGLITFYTGSEKEVNAWSIKAGAGAKEAAGVIHTDLEKGFVTAEVVNVDELIKAGGWASAKEAALVKSKGADYIVQDGDYMIVNSTK